MADIKPAPKPAPTQTAWEFTEDFDIGIAPPEAPARGLRSTSMPFATKFFTPAMGPALEGKKPHKFIPKAFFLGRAEKPEKVNGSYMKTKIRDQFNKWKKQQAPAVQEALTLLMHERTGKEEGFNEPGISVWIMTATPKASNK